MLNLQTPRGLPVRVPEDLAEDKSPHFDAAEVEAIRNYYQENGYVVVRSVFPGDVCDLQRRLWSEEVKPFKGYIYRQATAKAERHRLNEKNWVMNPILNLQSVDPKEFPRFRKFATESVLAAPPVKELFQALIGDSPKIVQSMYFEGNSATWEHQDSYYLDSEVPGEMAAAWIALEDIAPRAGRFFVCPGSHRIKLDEHSLENNIAEHHDVYISSVVRKIKELNLEIRAPALRKGDVLFWNAWTIHGSLDSQDTDCSRSSITCHAIPASRKFLQHQYRVMDLDAHAVGNTLIYRPKDLARLKNRLIFAIETNLPGLFYKVKQAAVKYMISRHSH